MDQEKVRSLYSSQVVPFLKYRLGGQLSGRIAAHVLGMSLDGIAEEREGFLALLVATKEFAIDRHPVLALVFEQIEQRDFEKKFLSVYDEANASGPSSSLEEVFDSLVAGYLEDILGKELVDTVRKVFVKAVAGVPDQPLDVRFYIGMQAIYHFIPDVWSEMEFAEKVKELSRLLPEQETVDATGEAQVDFDDLLERVIVTDLADILGRGHAMETVIRSAKEKTVGIFYDQQDRFATFVNNLLEDDFLSRMFDTFWMEERRKKWIEEVALILER